MFEEILVDAKSNSFSDDVKVSSREVILRVVANRLERESRRVSSGDGKGRHNLTGKIRKASWYKKGMGHRVVSLSMDE